MFLCHINNTWPIVNMSHSVAECRFSFLSLTASSKNWQRWKARTMQAHHQSGVEICTQRVSRIATQLISCAGSYLGDVETGVDGLLKNGARNWLSIMRHCRWLQTRRRQEGEPVSGGWFLSLFISPKELFQLKACY